MTRTDDRPEQAELRRRAEEVAREKADAAPENLEELSHNETCRMFHELQVHQIELEMQNEELLRTQAELDAARERYFDLYDLAPVGYCTISEQGLILEANLAAANLLGMARGTLVKQPVSRFIHKEDQGIYYLHRKQLVETGEPRTYELRMVKIDGTAFWANLTETVAQDGDGAPVYRIVISDITGRKNAKTALQESEARYRSLYEGAAEGILVAEVETGRFLRANPAFCRMMGYSHEEISAMGVENIHPAESLKYVLAEFNALACGKKLQSVDIPCLRRDGTILYADIAGSAILIDGKICNVGFFTDVTERKQAEKERERLILELKDALEKVKTLSGLLPICSCCKKIRDDKGYWTQLEVYFCDHSDAEFSHGLCPECADKTMKEFEEFMKLEEDALL
jgi:PAS domain S-box-containing protein